MKKETTYNYSDRWTDHRGNARKVDIEYTPSDPGTNLVLYVDNDPIFLTLEQADHLYRFVGSVLEDIARQKDGE